MNKKAKNRLRLWGFARSLHYVLLDRQKPAKRRPPKVLWRYLATTLRREELARSHKLLRAAEVQRRMLLDQIGRLIGRLGEFAAEVSAGAEPPVPTVRRLFEELIAIEEAFDGIQFDEGDILVVTKSIIMRGVNLGPFQIRVDTSRIGKPWFFHVIAREPRPAASDPDVVHPHLSGRLLETDDEEKLAQAMEAGKLFDFFQLVVQGLRTYAPERALIPLSEWRDRCGRCDAPIDYDEEDDEDELCNRCEMSLCGSCAQKCWKCDAVLCPQCAELGLCRCFYKEKES